MTGGFSPSAASSGEPTTRLVCESMRLADGTLWPIPITLDVDDSVAGRLSPGARLALRDATGDLVAVLQRRGRLAPGPRAEAQAVFGTTDSPTPASPTCSSDTHDWYVGGTVEALRPPSHDEHLDLRHTPAQLRTWFAAEGWHRVVGFQTRNPMHRAHVELARRAAADVDAKLLVNPVVGIGKPGDIPAAIRVRCYRAVMPSFPAGTARLSLLPLAMRMAGPREAVWHAIIRKNHGVSHFIVGRDHAGPGERSDGRPFYGMYEAQELLADLQAELGVTMIPFQRVVYVPSLDEYQLENEVPEGTETWFISGTEQRRRLAEGLELPSWFTPPEVAEELRRRD